MEIGGFQFILFCRWIGPLVVGPTAVLCLFALANLFHKQLSISIFLIYFISSLTTLGIVATREIYGQRAIMKISRFSLIVLITISFISQAQGAKWLNIGSDQDGTEYLYDSETITRLQTDIIEVWVKLQYSLEGRRKCVQERKSLGFNVDRYDTLGHSLTLEEVNCTTRQARTVTFADYSTDSAVLLLISKNHQTSESWEPIHPESIGEKMYMVICHQRLKGRQ